MQRGEEDNKPGPREDTHISFLKCDIQNMRETEHLCTVAGRLQMKLAHS